MESLKTCSQIRACDHCNLGTHQFILKEGGGRKGSMEFIWGENIFSEIFKQRKPNFGGQKYCFSKIPYSSRESIIAFLIYGDQAFS